jgi:Protein of unknown function (DUF3037)
MSGQLTQLDFTIVRYVPNIAKEEFINIGVIMLEPGVKGGFADLQFLSTWRRVHQFDLEVDLDWILAMESDLRTQLLGASDRLMFMNKLYDSFSGQVQLSRVMTCQTVDPAVEFARAVDFYLTAPFTPKKSNTSTGTTLIRHQMKNAFAEAGAIVLENLPVSEYTIPNDPFKFDFGYRTSEEIKLFQAVSLKSGTMPARLLAADFPAIAVALKMKVRKVPILTAVVDDDLDRTKAHIVFVLHRMENAGITVAPVSEMPRIAERARREIRLS